MQAREAPIRRLLHFTGRKLMLISHSNLLNGKIRIVSYGQTGKKCVPELEPAARRFAPPIQQTGLGLRHRFALETPTD